MNRLFLATRDEALAQKMAGALHGGETLNRVDDEAQLQRISQTKHATVLLVDPRFFKNLNAFDQWRNQASTHLLILLVNPDSSHPRLRVDENKVTFLSPDAGLSEIRTLVNLALRKVADPITNVPSVQEAAPRTLLHHQSAPPFGFGTFLRAMRNHENSQNLFEKILDGLVAATGVSRAGLVLYDPAEKNFKIQAHHHALPHSLNTTIPLGNPFIHWFEHSGIPLLPTRLPQSDDPLILRTAQEAFELTGAEILVPLLSRGLLQGWIFLGRRATGHDFTTQDIHDLTAIADHLSLLIENHRLQHDLMLQKTLAETLMHRQPTGILSCDQNGIIRWYNHAAEKTLGIPTEEVIGRNKDLLKSRVGPLLTEVLEAEETAISTSWIQSNGSRHLTAIAHRLEEKDGKLIGAVAFITDQTDQKELREKEEDLDWLNFWKELGASISHELYNPLTPILIFAEMLETKHADQEFRTQFASHVNESIEKITLVVDKINALSATPSLTFGVQSISPLLKDLVEIIKHRPFDGETKIELTIANNLPMITIDPTLVLQAIEHLSINALEALTEIENPKIIISAREGQLPDGRNGIFVSISDNGEGIPPDMLKNIFSPFYSTKARGIGLGLPIARRIATAHQGLMTVDSSNNGTTVSLLLPEKRI